MGLNRKGVERYMHRSQAVLEELYPGEVTVEGFRYQGSASALRKTSQYEPGGELEGADLSLRISKEVLRYPWEVGARLTYHDRDTGTPVEMRILEQTADEAAWIFRCGSVGKALPPTGSSPGGPFF